MTDPAYGRRSNTPEDIAEDIINQSGEGIDDLVSGTEVPEEFDDSEFISVEDLLKDSDDDGGDYNEW